MPNTCRTDSFISGRLAPVSVVACMAPHNRRDLPPRRGRVSPPPPAGKPKSSLLHSIRARVGAHKSPCIIKSITTTGDSAQSDRLQGVVGADDLLQPRLEGPVAAVGIGVKPFHELLVARLDGGRISRLVET